MPLSIRNPQVEGMARRLAEESGESLTQAVLHALEDRLARIRGSRTEQDLVEQILDIARRCGSLPDLDGRTAEEILGYRDDGAIE